MPARHFELCIAGDNGWFCIEYLRIEVPSEVLAAEESIRSGLPAGKAKGLVRNFWKAKNAQLARDGDFKGYTFLLRPSPYLPELP